MAINSMLIGQDVAVDGPQLIFVGANSLKDNQTHNTVYKDIFYAQRPTDGTTWSEFFPYQLEMVLANSDGQPVSLTPRRVFVLPISPSELQIRTPFAVQVSATLKGIIEEHNAAPFREISFSGTTGVLPGDLRPKNPAFQQPSGFLQTVFGGTIRAANNVSSNFNRLLAAPAAPAVSSLSNLKFTGHFHFRMFYNFLEQYMMEKRGINNQIVSANKAKKLRLMFTTFREECSWYVTPREFTWRKTVNDPHLYFYSFAATAWKRVSTRSQNPTASPFLPIAQRPNGFQEALNRMDAAVRTVYGAKTLIGAVRSDLNGKLLDPLRETVLFLKESAGVAVALIDLPTNVRNDFLQTVARSWDTLKTSMTAVPQALSQSLGQLQTISVNTTESQTKLPPDTANPAIKFFATPTPDPNFFSQINLNSLSAPQELNDRVEAERERVRGLRQHDFEADRRITADAAEEIANGFGLGSASYSRLVGMDSRSPVATYVQPDDVPTPTDSQMAVLYALQECLQVMDSLVASGTIDDNAIPSSLEYVAALSNASNIPFDIPVSKYLVPVPYGATLESIALLYTGDPNRWSEIATLNGLLPPYIDEVGFALEMLTNGSGNQFTVADLTNLFTGQTIKLYSSTVPTFKRRILTIESISAGNVLITVDGDDDLGILKKSDHATMRAFLPGTTNSEQLIYVPGNAEAPSDPKLRSIPGIDDTDRMVQISGIDLLLTDKGDIVITPDGDTRLAYGMTNLVQAIRLKIATPRGSLLRHPSYGFDILSGTSTADLTPGSILQSVQGSFAGDDRYDGVDALQVLKSGPVLQLNVATRVSNLSVLLPVSVQVPLPS